MNPEAVLSLCLLVPFIYAGLYALTDPSSSIRVVNKVMADSASDRGEHSVGRSIRGTQANHRLPHECRTMRCASPALAIMAAGLFRLYSL